MRRTRKSVLLTGAGGAAAVCMAAVAWACTNMGGELWFCSGSSCTWSNKLTGSALYESRAVYVNGDGMQKNKTYTIRYRSGQDTTDNCKDSSSTWGSGTTANGAVTGYMDFALNTGVAATLPSTDGSYELCGTVGASPYTYATYETWFTVVNP